MLINICLEWLPNILMSPIAFKINKKKYIKAWPAYKNISTFCTIYKKTEEENKWKIYNERTASSYEGRIIVNTICVQKQINDVYGTYHQICLFFWCDEMSRPESHFSDYLFLLLTLI